MYWERGLIYDIEQIWRYQDVMFLIKGIDLEGSNILGFYRSFKKAIGRSRGYLNLDDG